MTWREFSDLLSCLSIDTPLGRIVAIRSEKDTKVISEFTPAQKKIRNDWINANRKEMNEQEYAASMDEALNMLLM